MAFLDKLLGKNEMESRLHNEIRSLELRKESVLAAINKEIAHLENERANIFLAAGTEAYELWSKEKKQAVLSEFWKDVDELNKKILEQESKRIDMEVRYDDEIGLIRKSIEANVGNASTVKAEKKCPSCGLAVTKADVFCQNCGTKLQ